MIEIPAGVVTDHEAASIVVLAFDGTQRRRPRASHTSGPGRRLARRGWRSAGARWRMLQRMPRSSFCCVCYLMTTGRRATSVAATEHLREASWPANWSARAVPCAWTAAAGRVKRSRTLVSRDGGDAVADVLVRWQLRRRLGHHARFDDIDRLCHDARHGPRSVPRPRDSAVLLASPRHAESAPYTVNVTTTKGTFRAAVGNAPTKSLWDPPSSQCS